MCICSIYVADTFFKNKITIISAKNINTTTEKTLVIYVPQHIITPLKQ